MVGPGKGSLTESALKRTIAGVFAEMSGEFVTSGELPSATLPIALIGLFARMCPQMRLQV